MSSVDPAGALMMAWVLSVACSRCPCVRVSVRPRVQGRHECRRILAATTWHATGGSEKHQRSRETRNRALNRGRLLPLFETSFLYSGAIASPRRSWPLPCKTETRTRTKPCVHLLFKVSGGTQGTRLCQGSAAGLCHDAISQSSERASVGWMGNGGGRASAPGAWAGTRFGTRSDVTDAPFMTPQRSSSSM